MALTFQPLTGDDLAGALDDIAALRISVFREWPYLYDGDAAYEQAYLKRYLESTQALVVGAFDDKRLVGAATGTPLTVHAEDFARAFADRPEPLESIFYCAESVLLPQYRGQGAGHAFFDAREAHARALGYQWVCFCAVMRSDDHPHRPQTYRPLDGFWRKRGYAPVPGVFASFSWKDLGHSSETAKPLQFWMRAL